VTHYNKKPQFITVEGIEGVGKSTCVQYLHQCLEHAGIAHIVTREPGGTEIAENIRRVLLDHYDEPMEHLTELLLMFACRSQHIAHVIKPALLRNQWVLCDRFTDASFAYQGGGRNMDLNKIKELEHWLQNDWQPDLTLLLTASVPIALERAKQRKGLDRIETEAHSFFERVQAMYLQRAKKYPERFIIINAERPLPIIQQEISQRLRERYELSLA
jgi:dTMP kinase